jgi:outer membrane immunogenic protein
MKRFVLAGLLLLGLDSLAFAAPPAPAFSWTGFYIGGNAGYGWGNAKEDVTYVQPLFGATPPGFSQSESTKLNGIIGGAQIGYNWHAVPNWVFGIEADWQGAGQKGDDAFPTFHYTVFPFTSGTVDVATGAKISWFGTVRGRVGYAWDRWLVYATGGFAYGRVSASASTAETSIANAPGITFVSVGTSASSDASTKAGWAVGGGIENALTDKWTWKIEYLYLSLGSLDLATSGPIYIGESTTVHANFVNHVVRFGLNYKFSGP